MSSFTQFATTMLMIILITLMIYLACSMLSSAAKSPKPRLIRLHDYIMADPDDVMSVFYDPTQGRVSMAFKTNTSRLDSISWTVKDQETATALLKELSDAINNRD